MKKLFILCLAAALSMGVQAQVKTQKVNVSEVKPMADSNADKFAEIKFDTLRHNFGTFSKNEPIVNCSFAFTNTGTAPLVIHQALASCGCTVPRFTKEPIAPGERGAIDVTYNGKDKFPGHFQKTITIRTNALTEVVRLVIEGTMEE